MRHAARLVLGVTASFALAGAAPGQTRITDVQQGTNLALALSPDRQTLVFSLLGGLWRMPVSGGAAEALTATGLGADNPRFAPQGGRVVYQRDDTGQSDLWLLELDTSSQRRLTDTPYDEREPDFSPDGRRVVFSSNRSGRYQLWSLDLTSGATHRIGAEHGDEALYPAVSSRGDIAYVARGRGGWSLRVRSAAGYDSELLHSDGVLGGPSWRPGGGVLVFHEREGLTASRLKMLVEADVPVVKTLTGHEDVFAARVAWSSSAQFLYAADGRIWRRSIGSQQRAPVPLFAGVGVPAPPPVSVRTPLDAPGPYPVSGVNGWTASPSGRQFAFTALGDLWLFEGKQARRLTDDSAVDIDPAFFPDGRHIVFASDRTGQMDLWSIGVDGGEPTRLSREDGKAFAPAVDPKGGRVAYLTTSGFGPWAESRLRLLDVSRGGEPRTLAEGLVDAADLTWVDGPDGTERLAVRARASAVDAVRQRRVYDLTGQREATALPEPPAAAAATPPPFPQDTTLEWSVPAPGEPYVVQVGRLFDGIRNDYLRHMDIHVKGERIEAIVARGILPLPDKVIDVRDATIIPGLIDVHAHQSALSGERLGRSWLAYGVTTVRELAHDVPEALERGEAWASGRRLGPRLVVTPTRRALESGPVPDPASPVIVLGADRLPDGFGHSVARSEEALGATEPPLPATIRDLGTPADATALRLSPLHVSYSDTVGTIIASGAFVSSSLSAVSEPGLASPAAQAASPLARLFSPAERRRWSRQRQRLGETTIEPLQQTLARVVRGGGHVAAGSDAPAVPYGLGLQQELRLLADAGIPNDQVLRIASAEGAMALGLSRQIGTLEAGRLADFIVLSGDPLTRIEDTQTILAVVKGGRWLSRERLLGEH
jgi:Tol biopolymer transport system component